MRLATAILVACVGCRSGFDAAPDATGDDAAPDAAPIAVTVQRGNAILPLGMQSISVPVTAVDLAHALLVFRVSAATVDPQDGLVEGTLNAASISFARVASGPTVTISWQVIELPTLIDVQRGTVPKPGSGINSTTVAIAQADPAVSFVIASWRDGGSNYDEDDYVRARLTSPTTLDVNDGNPPGGASLPTEVAYQVVTLHSGSVLHGDASFSAGIGEQVSVAALDPQRAFPLVNWYSDDDTCDVGSLALRAEVSETQVRITRERTALPVVAAWSAVTIPSATIQHGTTSLAAGAASATATLSSVDLSRSFVLVDGATTLYPGVPPDDQVGIAWVRADLSSSMITFQRDVTIEATTVSWSVITF